MCLIRLNFATIMHPYRETGIYHQLKIDVHASSVTAKEVCYLESRP